MGNKIRAGILFKREKVAYTQSYTDLVTFTRSSSANGRLPCAVLKLPVEILPFIHLKDNEHIYNYKNRKLNHGNSIHLLYQLSSTK